MQSISLVLCNDKPQTFGAPDVLRVSVDQLMVKYVMEQHFHDRPPDQVSAAVFLVKQLENRKHPVRRLTLIVSPRH